MTGMRAVDQYDYDALRDRLMDECGAACASGVWPVHDWGIIVLGCFPAEWDCYKGLPLAQSKDVIRSVSQL